MSDKIKPSWFDRHKHVLRFTYIAIAAALAVMVYFMIGKETFIRWVEGGARSQGYELSAPETEPSKP